MAVLVPQENLQDGDGKGGVAISREETRWRGFIGSDREKEVASQRRGQNKTVREKGDRERLFAAKKERETRRASLISWEWDTRTRDRERKSRSYSVILVSFQSYYCHATAEKRPKHLLPSLTCKDHFWGDEDNVFDDETSFTHWNLETQPIGDKFHTVRYSTIIFSILNDTSMCAWLIGTSCIFNRWKEILSMFSRAFSLRSIIFSSSNNIKIFA